MCSREIRSSAALTRSSHRPDTGPDTRLKLGQDGGAAVDRTPSVGAAVVTARRRFLSWLIAQDGRSCGPRRWWGGAMTDGDPYLRFVWRVVGGLLMIVIVVAIPVLGNLFAVALESAFNSYPRT